MSTTPSLAFALTVAREEPGSACRPAIEKLLAAAGLPPAWIEHILGDTPEGLTPEGEDSFLSATLDPELRSRLAVHEGLCDCADERLGAQLARLAEQIAELNMGLWLGRGPDDSLVLISGRPDGLELLDVLAPWELLVRAEAVGWITPEGASIEIERNGGSSGLRGISHPHALLLIALGLGPELELGPSESFALDQALKVPLELAELLAWMLSPHELSHPEGTGCEGLREQLASVDELCGVLAALPQELMAAATVLSRTWSASQSELLAAAAAMLVPARMPLTGISALSLP